MIKSNLGRLIAGTFAGLLCASSALAAKHQINVVHLSNMDDEDYDGALVFKDYVEAQSNGQIAVTIYPGGQLCGNAVECLEATQGNLIQVFQTTTGGISNIFPEIQALDIPYMFSSDRIAECALDSSLSDEIRQAVLDKTGSLRLMTVGNTGGWRNFATTKRAVKSPSDVEGMKIRTINSPLQMELVKSMGGSPTPISWPEVYTSLATGVVEGTKNGITDIMGMKFNEHLKYITLDGHAYMASMWWMNDAAFKSMSPALQHIVMDGFDALRTVTTVLPKRRQIEAYQAFRESGGTIYAPTAEQREEFKVAAEPIRDWFKDKYGSEWLEITDLAVAQCESQIQQAYRDQVRLK